MALGSWMSLYFPAGTPQVVTPEREPFVWGGFLIDMG